MNKFLLIVCAFIFVGCADLDNETSINEVSEELRYYNPKIPKINTVTKNYLEATKTAMIAEDYDRANLLLALIASGNSFYRNCPRIPKVNSHARYQVEFISVMMFYQDYYNAFNTLNALLENSGVIHEFSTPAGACPKN
jgi:hypothetical protein